MCSPPIPTLSSSNLYNPIKTIWSWGPYTCYYYTRIHINYRGYLVGREGVEFPDGSNPREPEVQQAIHRFWAGFPKKNAPTELGVRWWASFDGKLYSPMRYTPWKSKDLYASGLSTETMVENREGIHARRFPRMWKDWYPIGVNEMYPPQDVVTGIVERFGNFVLGEKGWRSEWVVIKELQAHPSIVSDLYQTYPDVQIHERRNEPWISEELLKQVNDLSLFGLQRNLIYNQKDLTRLINSPKTSTLNSPYQPPAPRKAQGSYKSSKTPNFDPNTYRWVP